MVINKTQSNIITSPHMLVLDRLMQHNWFKRIYTEAQAEHSGTHLQSIRLKGCGI